MRRYNRREQVKYYSEISTKATDDYRMFKRYHAVKMENEQEIIGWKIDINGSVLKEYLIRKKGGQIRLRLTKDNQEEQRKVEQKKQLNLW
nr:MAG TPA: hypothetical protein [Microviridae sp.]